MHSENFERFFSYYHKMIQSLENFFVSNKRDLLHFRFPVDRLLPKTRSFILKLSKRGELLDFPKKKMGGTQFYIFNVRRKSRKKNSSTSFKLSTTPLRNAFHSLRETLAKFFFYFLSPSASTRKSIRSFICRVSTSRSSNLGWNSRPRLAGCEPLQGSAPLFSLLSSSLRFSFWPFGTATGPREDR